MAFQACVDDHVSLPVALAFDDQSTHRTLERFATILGRALRAAKTTLLQGQSEVCTETVPSQMGTTVFADLQVTTTPHVMVKTLKGNASWKQCNKGSKNSSMF